MKSVAYGLDARSSSFVAWAAMILAVVLGVVIASDFGLLLLVFFVVMLALPLAYVGMRQLSDRNGWLLLVGWLLMLCANATQYLIHIPVGYLLELLLFGMALGSVSLLWRQAQTDRTLRVLLMIFGFYMGLAVLSTFTGRSHKLAAVWQLQYNLKWPLMFALGFLLAWGPAAERQLQRIVRYSWLFLAACVVLEIAAPGVQASIFGPPPDLHQNPILGFGLRYRGPFMHSGYLAIISALLASAAIALSAGGKGSSWLLVALPYFALLVLSGQRQETAALVLALGLMGLVYGWRYRYLALGAILFILILGMTVIAYTHHIPMETTLEDWGILSSASALSERAILTMKGVSVAYNYFPLAACRIGRVWRMVQ